MTRALSGEGHALEKCISAAYGGIPHELLCRRQRVLSRKTKAQ